MRKHVYLCAHMSHIFALVMPTRTTRDRALSFNVQVKEVPPSLVVTPNAYILFFLRQDVRGQTFDSWWPIDKKRGMVDIASVLANSRNSGGVMAAVQERCVIS